MSLTSRIQALTAYANEVTGESDTTLADAVATLADGYGSGGGGSSPVTLTYDKTITTNGGRDAAHTLVDGLMDYDTFQVEGYVYWTGKTSAATSRINYGYTSEPFAAAFMINASDNTQTLFKITGERSDSGMVYKYYYNNVLKNNVTIRYARFDCFAFHWLSDVTADAPIVIHATVKNFLDPQ